VFLSNIPQALAPSADLATEVWRWTRMLAMWGVVVIACGVTAGLGFAVADAFGATGGRAATFAAGGLLAMLRDSLMPYAFDRGGSWAGAWTSWGSLRPWRPREMSSAPEETGLRVVSGLKGLFDELRRDDRARRPWLRGRRSRLLGLAPCSPSPGVLSRSSEAVGTGPTSRYDTAELIPLAAAV
jgi:hypothetical protein